MTEGRPTEEELAAFTSGELPEDDRRRVASYLAQHPEELSLIAGVDAFLRSELAQHDVAPTAAVTDQPSLARTQQPPAHALLAGQRETANAGPLAVAPGNSSAPFSARVAGWAAAAVLVVSLAVLGLIQQRSVEPWSLSSAAQGPQLARALGPGWAAPQWSATRGSSAQPLQLERRRRSSFRLGVLVVKLDTALRADDIAAARTAANEINRALSDLTSTRVLQLAYEELESGLADQLPEQRETALLKARDLQGLVAEVVEGDHYLLARTLEAHRIDLLTSPSSAEPLSKRLDRLVSHLEDPEIVRPPSMSHAGGATLETVEDLIRQLAD